MKRALTTFSVLLLVLATFVVAAMSANAESEELFLIGFDGNPNEKLIRQCGGKITATHSNANVITARLTPRESRSLARNRDIAYVEKDFTLRIDAQTLPWGVDHIDADLVHSSYKGNGVKVAVIDTGIDYSHPDLDGNYKGGYDFVNDDTYPMDDHGHGTHVAGTIAAEDNDIGVIGVAPEADLYALKVIDSSGYGVASDLISAIEWAVDNDIDVISMSIGSNYASSSLLDACDAAENAGLVLVAAAGNDGTLGGTEDTVDYPARYGSVIAVGAIDQYNNRPSWSSTGSSVELAAPGVSIYSTRISSSYGTKSGTSMACPHVSGVAALILSSDPDLINTEVRETMQTTASDLGLAGRDTFFGFGMVDAAEAIPVEEPNDELPTVSLTSPGDGSTVSDSIVIQASASDDNGVVKVSFYLDGALLGVDTTSPYSYTWDTTAASDGAHTIKAIATDTIDQTAEDSVTITVDNPDPEPLDSMHVASIDMSYSTVSRTYTIYTNVKIVDEGSSPVQGATVKILLRFGARGKYSVILSGVTGSDGTVTLAYGPTKQKQTYEATVTDVLKTDWTYDSTANLETKETIRVK